MKKKALGFFIIGWFININVSAQETFKVMFYNLLNYPLENAVPNRQADLGFILFNYQPDLFLVCELNNINGANNVLDITRLALNSNFEMATYASNTSDDTTGNQNDLQNLLYYDSTKFILEEEIIVPTDLRDFNIYKLLLNTIDQDINPIELYIVVCHLKASSGEVNAQRRFNMILELENYLDTLPQNTNVMLGGDLNVYRSSELAFQELINNTNNITFVDPANRIGNWNNNSSFVDVFTQSTRTQNGLGGSTGGFDDRFDFILTSENMLSTANITYVPNSYQVYGNNGLASCYNRAINSSDCAIAGSEFSFQIRDALHNFSDHLPVTLSLETDATLLSINEFESVKCYTLEKTLNNSKLIVYINSYKLKNEYISIYNTLGKQIKTLQTNSDQKQQFDVSGLENGVYFLSFENSDLKPTKFVIQH
ncbi:T9SS type A sorting domain-containing protein [uncultured Winogradskyella sp.]|uniref:T9SS type A sorting domain-containing protein n=1 Tax=uncultured Winogradskyella sp. TaxID=395353 RepID=UPI002613D41C|nr:T9SS type A sorting domain-containing protein [uncultured Winogradskyella sp.]